MADFKTHLMGAALVSGVSATLLSVSVNDLDDEAVLGFFTVGVIGGLLPDIDLDTAVPIRIGRRVVTTVVTLLMVLRFAPRYSLVELLIVALATFTLLQAGFELFGRLTVHRGLIHSLPVGAAFGLATGLFAHDVLGVQPVQAWFHTSFLAIGFLTHLILDECYSVDLLGARLKKSFGSAVKLGDRGNLLGTLAAYTALVALLAASPPSGAFTDLLSDGATYNRVLERVVPDGTWFE